MRTRYRIDTYQKTYFVIDSFEQLIDATAPGLHPDLRAAGRSRTRSRPATCCDTDRVFHRGTGEGWATDGDV